MDNKHIKNSVVNGSVRSGYCVRCKQNYGYNQNYIGDRNKSEVQKFKIVIDKEDKCKNMRQRNTARKCNINPLNTKLNPICHLLALLGAHHILHVRRVRVNNTTEGQNNNDLSLTHILPHKQSIEIYHQNIRSLRNKMNEIITCIITHLISCV